MKKALVLFGLAGLALLVRAIFLGHQSLWFDEAFSTWVASHPVAEILKILHFDAHPPLFYTLLHYWMAGGRTEAYLRIPSVVCGAASTVLLYVLMEELLGNPAAGMTALFWAFSFAALNEETQVRMYAPAVTLSLAATYCFWKAYMNPSVGRWILYVVFASLSLYTHYYTGFIVLAHGIFLVSRGRYRESAWVTLAVFLVFYPNLPLFLDQYLYGVDKGLPSPGVAFFSAYPARVVLLPRFFSNADDWVASAGVMAAFFFGTFRMAKERKEAALFLLLLFGIPSLFPYAVSELTPRHIFLLRYAVLYLPYFFAVIFFGLSRLRPKAGYALCGALILVNLSFWLLFLLNPNYQRQNWKAAARVLRASLATGDALYFEQQMSQFTLWYYLPGNLEVNFRNRQAFELKNRPGAPRITWYRPEKGFFDQGPEVYTRILENSLRSSKRQWVISCEPQVVDPKLKLVKWFLKNRRLVSFREYKAMSTDNDIAIFLFSGGKRTTKPEPVAH